MLGRESGEAEGRYTYIAAMPIVILCGLGSDVNHYGSSPPHSTSGPAEPISSGSFIIGKRSWIK